MAEAQGKKFQIPVFQCEADEAQWWFDNRERLAEEFELAAAEGRLGQGAAERRGVQGLQAIAPNQACTSKVRA